MLAYFIIQLDSIKQLELLVAGIKLAIFFIIIYILN